MLEFARGSFFGGLFGVENGGKTGVVRVRPLVETRERLRSAGSAH
jgi:hypothetical protein